MSTSSDNLKRLINILLINEIQLMGNLSLKDLIHIPGGIAEPT